MKRIARIVIKRVADPDPDLSWLKTEMQDGRIVNSCRYSDTDIEKHGLDQVVKWIEADHQRLAEFGQTWHMIGIFAEA